MLRPSIFGESLFDDWMDDFPFGKEFEKAMFPAKDPLYGKHAKNMMKTDVRETDDAYEVDIAEAFTSVRELPRMRFRRSMKMVSCN